MAQFHPEGERFALADETLENTSEVSRGMLGPQVGTDHIDLSVCPGCG